jgi:hypothetical protein
LKPPTIASTEFDLLQHIAVLLRCSTCSQPYSVSLRLVQTSWEVNRDGRPEPHQAGCLPATYAALAYEATRREFERGWSGLLNRVRAAGVELTVCRGVLSH